MTDLVNKSACNKHIEELNYKAGLDSCFFKGTSQLTMKAGMVEINTQIKKFA
jgi:hypothetical protein